MKLRFIVINIANPSKEYDICHYWYILDKGFNRMSVMDAIMYLWCLWTSAILLFSTSNLFKIGWVGRSHYQIFPCNLQISNFITSASLKLFTLNQDHTSRKVFSSSQILIKLRLWKLLPFNKVYISHLWWNDQNCNHIYFKNLQRLKKFKRIGN